ncbi:MAG: hypothetical protein Q8K58_00595 [Acidimicrobiales bacterium]|nr:hypothetical protein [Acidimicrobiales bacterium]
MSIRALVSRAVLLGAALLPLVAAPAGADPAGPTDFRSEVTEITPSVDGVRAEIRGGDAFLELTVERGHEVVVYGYEPDRAKPYLRFLEDGTVQRNRNATATYINDDRQGGGEIPAVAEDPDSAPDWEDVATGGRYAWHDHRVHWMAGVDPPVERGEPVGGGYDPWVVPLDVDGEPIDVRGTLVFEKTTSPVPFVAAGLVAAGLLAWVGRRRPVQGAAVALAVVAAIAVVVGRAEVAATPDGGANPLLWIPPAAALVAAGLAAIRHRGGAAVVLVLASVSMLSGWALLRFEVLLKPVLPTDLPPSIDRVAVTVAMGVSLASAYLAITSGTLKLPDLEDDPQET